MKIRNINWERIKALGATNREDFTMRRGFLIGMAVFSVCLTIYFTSPDFQIPNHLNKMKYETETGIYAVDDLYIVQKDGNEYVCSKEVTTSYGHAFKDIQTGEYVTDTTDQNSFLRNFSEQLTEEAIEKDIDRKMIDQQYIESKINGIYQESTEQKVKVKTK